MVLQMTSLPGQDRMCWGLCDSVCWFSSLNSCELISLHACKVNKVSSSCQLATLVHCYMVSIKLDHGLSLASESQSGCSLKAVDHHISSGGFTLQCFYLL